MLTKQVSDIRTEYKKCYKLCDNIVKAFSGKRSLVSDSGYRWDYANRSDVLSVMNVPPSPNGSINSGNLSSEDSSTSSTTFGFGSSHPSPPTPTQYPHLVRPTASSSHSFGLAHNKTIKHCRVCGDRAKSYHFGGISCDSCKAFFRRSVQNEAYRNFHCPYERHCEITINSRKSCQYCRFNKCLSIGMEKSWVMTEEERMLMLKNRIEKRKQDKEIFHQTSKTSVKQNDFYWSKYEPDISQINAFLSQEEVELIENLVNIQLKCWREIPFLVNRHNEPQPNRTHILNIFFTAIQQFTLFAQRFQSFTCLSNQDKQILLRDGVLELCFLRGAFNYDIKGKYWRYDDRSEGVVFSDHLEIMFTKSLLEKHINFIRTIKRLHLDEATYILLTIIVFLSPDRPALLDTDSVQKEQEKYLILLKNYMNWRYGTQVSSLLYPKLLYKLTDLRELAEAHTDYHLSLCKQELNQVKCKLSTLSIRNDASNSDPISANTSDKPVIDQSVRWNIGHCLADKGLSHCQYVDEELSTSSEGSEKFSSD